MYLLRASTTFHTRVSSLAFRAVFHSSVSTMTEYKLVGLTALDLKPGEKRAVDVEGVEKAQVLLANVGGKVQALSPKCTHFGAPLVKGVLHGDRLTCPWHGGEKSDIDLAVLC
jgi:Rieske [2Fe-2S] domain